MKILVIATGGTIGSIYDGASVNVSTDTSAAVVDLYRQHHGGVDFTIIHPLNILSENLNADDLRTLSSAVYETRTDAYDGMIFLTGSDSLAYIAAYIGLVHGGIGLPVAIVASNKALDHPKANGLLNFICAVEVIKSGFDGAFVPYQNSDGVMAVHAATDICQAMNSDDFYSFNGAYGVFDNGLKVNREYIAQTVPDIYTKDDPPVMGRILQIFPYPMLDYDTIRIGESKAILHTLYHSATLNADQAKKLVHRAGIPMYLASLRSGGRMYKTTADIIEAGAIPLYDISPSCAYIKLCLAAAQTQTRLTIREFMEA